jgi:geranyl-CoA carboxylase alpha subunit
MTGEAVAPSTGAGVPFSRILIANRGEIALRIIRTAHRMGYETVAVYSTADADSPHVHAATTSACIGEPAPSQSYLNVDAILDAARRTDADAVHPGYGFLAENPGFAQACLDAGLVFIGPSAQAIRAMGDKAGAKALMAQAGVPCIPGYAGEDQSPERLRREADKVGYPLMIKATAGGGGRGMRLVRSAAEFADALRSAQSEAQNAFGDATVLLERAVLEPRHVEIQVFADRHGHAVHLGERDCSVQRRHQKLVEESPSPAVDAELRERMGAAAVAAVKAIRYEGAGTLEFLLDRDGRFWFMEMNTRLQVEHPVTEALTGFDLVEWQLRVAACEPLPVRQQDIRFEGHAIEVRLCAEDAAKGFLPQAGVLRAWQPPAGLRVEHALRPGSTIPPFYDSMIAKLVAHGASRDEARRRLAAGLRELVALGVTTNQRFLLDTLQHPAFALGEATTAFVAQHGEELLAADPRRLAAAHAIAAWLVLAGKARAYPGRLTHALPVPVHVEVDGTPVKARVTQAGPRHWAVQAGEHTVEVACDRIDGASARVTLDGAAHVLHYAQHADRLWLQFDGRQHTVVNRTRAAAAQAGSASGDGKVRASMNGRVVAVLVEPGQKVDAKQPLATLEAMKMEHVHAAPAAGTVTAVHVTAGEQVQAGRVLVELGE